MSRPLIHYWTTHLLMDAGELGLKEVLYTRSHFLICEWKTNLSNVE